MIKLSARAEVNVNKVRVEPQVVLEIDGLPIFAAIKAFRIANVDEDNLSVDLPTFYLDIPTEDLNAKNLINLSGSTTNISQQLFQDKGMASSVSSMTIELIDKDQLLSQIIAPGQVLDDLLTNNATVYLNFGGGAHPEDSMPIIIGVIDEITAGVGSVRLSVAHPDGLKRQEVFTNIRAKTVSRLRYRSKIFNGINFQTQDRAVGIMTVVLASGTPGTVNVVGQTITVYITPNVTTDSEVVSYINDNQAAVNLISAEIAEGYANTPQVAGSVLLDSSDSVELDSTSGMLEPSSDGTIETYIRIEDEIIRYTSIDGNTLTGLSHGQFDTIPKTYELEADTSTFYRMIGTMKDIALKLMLSSGKPIGEEFVSTFRFDGTTQVANLIRFNDMDLLEKYPLRVGDFATSAGAFNAANNFERRTILEVGTIDTGSYIIVDGADLAFEGGGGASVVFESQYDVWPDGLGLNPNQVDIDRHEQLQATFTSGFFEYDFFLKDTIKGDEFLAKEVYFPSGCYALPRGGKASVGITLPPLAGATSKVIDESNVTNASALVMSRSINKNFYNGVVYKFDEDPVEDKFTKGVVTLSNSSINRIKNVKNKPLTIESKGIRDTDANRTKIDAQVRRFLDRYQYGAESTSVEVLFKTGFNIEVGDTVIFGTPALQIPDSTQGSRKFQPRIMEVQNKKMDIRTGRISLDLLTTAFTLNANYGVIAPSSLTASGSTESYIKLSTSVLTPFGEVETYKWKPYVGQKVLFHSVDWSYSEETVIVALTGANQEHVIVDPPLSVAPAAGTIMDAPQYPDSTDPNENYLWKLIHFYFSPRVQVVSQVDVNILEVSPSDIGKFYVGSPVRIHNFDFSLYTGEVDLIVTAIDGNSITLNTPIDFPVDSSFYIDGIGFKDKRAPYRLL